MFEASDSQRENIFFHNLLLFGRLLRSTGIDVPPYRMGDVLQAFEQIDLASKQDVFYTLRSLLVYAHEDYPLFEKAFQEFWIAWQHRWLSMSLPPVKAPHRPGLELVQVPESKAGLDPGEPDSGQPLPPSTVLAVQTTYSQNELLRQKDFAALTPQEIQAVYRLIETLDWTPDVRKTRRFRSGAGTQ